MSVMNKFILDGKRNDWKWQNANRITDAESFRKAFPNCTAELAENIGGYIRKFRFAATPYFLSLVAKDGQGNPLPGDPLWKQVCFHPADTPDSDGYADGKVNWENPAEFPTPILHHKYPDRALLRITDHCMCYCNYCYLTARILDKNTPKHNLFEDDYWEKSLDYIRKHTEIRDILISGGEPLLFDNASLEKVLAGIRGIGTVKTIRLNTRALSFNPFRFDNGLAGLFRDYRLTALEIHTSHPSEITPEFDDALSTLESSGYRPMILWRAPLLRGINDSAETLEKLFIMLYERRIEPYYLFHYAPYSLSRAEYGVSVRRGAAILRELRRRIPGPSFPRYTLFHIHGKQDIPLSENGTGDFIYETDKNGNSIVRFIDWKGEWSIYPDVGEKGNRP